jgi:hypothetical protein
MQQTQMESLHHLNGFQNVLMDSINEGAIAVSHHYKPVYLNTKAREICQQFWDSYYQSGHLPPIVSEVSRELIKRTEFGCRAIALDYQVSKEKTIRICARSLTVQHDNECHLNLKNSLWIMIFLQDRNAILQEELLIEQQKYNLSDRETQILRLLEQTCTYQDIANTFQISLNTVKFHVKNIYAKKRGYLEGEKIYFEIENFLESNHKSYE